MANERRTITFLLALAMLSASIFSEVSASNYQRDRGRGEKRGHEKQEARRDVPTLTIERGGINPEGQPGELRAGQTQRFFVWHDAQGWHVRTTTANERRRFHGSVSADGVLRDFRPYRTERRNDWARLSNGNRQIDFDLSTEEGLDGFDFNTDAAQVRFNLLVDAKERPNFIFIGARGSHPDTIPFALNNPRPLPRAVPVLSPAGKPRGMGEGSTHRYLVWRDNDGTWHLRTTTAGKPHKFSGEIEAEGGTITGLRPFSSEGKDWVGFASQNRLTFDLTTQGAIDGFDFRTNGTNLKFRLLIDGQARAHQVYVGEQATNPQQVPFSLPAR